MSPVASGVQLCARKAEEESLFGDHNGDDENVASVQLGVAQQGMHPSGVT
jgi:hypothetical protein